MKFEEIEKIARKELEGTKNYDRGVEALGHIASEYVDCNQLDAYLELCGTLLANFERKSTAKEKSQ